MERSFWQKSFLCQRFWWKYWTIVQCKGACSQSTFLVERIAQGKPCQHFVHIDPWERKMKRKMDLLIWLTWGLSDCSEDQVKNSLVLVYHWFCRQLRFCVCQSMWNSCIPIWKRERTSKFKFSVWKVTVEEMACKFGCLQRRKSSWVIANEQRTEAELRSDSRVRSLINVAEFNANFMDRLYHC